MDEGYPHQADEVDLGGGPYRTWDGHPVSQEPPHGAMIMVYRCRDGVPEFLLLHRRHHGPDYEGEWAWAPPSGARYPGEALEDCARRELEEETGLRLFLRPADDGTAGWPVFVAEAPADTPIALSPEHDRFGWLPLAEAAARVAPAAVQQSFTAVAETLIARCERGAPGPTPMQEER
jgi:8-oxo-dGTP pyrophosphatase MutT (NUDIX family)